MNIRTDLALERREMHGEGELEGVKMTVKETDECKSTLIEILSEEGEKALNKPKGKYFTLEADSFPDGDILSDGRLSLLKEALDSLITKEGTVLIAGLGNSDITPDGIGPLAVGHIFATRHIPEETEKALSLPELRSVCCVSPGVTGKTGIETGEIISGIKEKIKPSLIIVIDALVSRSISRLGRTIQLSNTGIAPGSGVGNRRMSINEETMGIPVISVGIPTVVDAATLAFDLTGKITEDKTYGDMMVTPKDTDILVSSGAKLIALAINSVLQKNLSEDEIISLTLP